MPDLAVLLAPYARYVVQARARSDGRRRLYVGRGKGARGRWGNPFAMQDQSEAERLRVVSEFALYVRDMDRAERERLLAPIREHLAAGGVLACWCAPKLCHAQVWAALALHGVVDDLE